MSLLIYSKRLACIVTMQSSAFTRTEDAADCLHWLAVLDSLNMLHTPLRELNVYKTLNAVN